MRTWTAVFMCGIGFTVGLLCGLLIHLPADSLPTADFNRHHLARVRRVAQVEAATDANIAAKGDGVINYGDNLNTQSDNLGLIPPGEASKHTGQSALVDTDYGRLPVKNQGDNTFKVLISEQSPHFGALNNKYPDKNSDSVVYVNPGEQKLVLNNNVNNGSDLNRRRGPHGGDSKLGNDVAGDKLHGAGQLEENLDINRQLALGHDVLIKGGTFTANQNEGSKSSGAELPVEGVYWSDFVENSCPKGFTHDEDMKWKTKARVKFVKMEEGCGRMQNRLLTFHDSGKACARYRLNVDQMQGEMYSYYLSKLLGINNVPPSTMQIANTNTDQWRIVSQGVANARWSEEKPVILSKWIDGLSPSFIPTEFRNLSNVFHPKQLLDNARATEGSSTCELLQWSDLIVFDYITANLDRVVNNLFNLQWNSRMMSKPAHNLERDSRGNLVFVDNESGLFHAYRLLDKYSSYHESLLNALCVFRQGTINSIRRLLETDSVADALHSLFEEKEPLHKYLPRIPNKNIKILKQRMGDVLKQVQKCESQNR